MNRNRKNQDGNWFRESYGENQQYFGGQTNSEYYNNNDCQNYLRQGQSDSNTNNSWFHPQRYNTKQQYNHNQNNTRSDSFNHHEKYYQRRQKGHPSTSTSTAHQYNHQQYSFEKEYDELNNAFPTFNSGSDDKMGSHHHENFPAPSSSQYSQNNHYDDQFYGKSNPYYNRLTSSARSSDSSNIQIQLQNQTPKIFFNDKNSPQFPKLPDSSRIFRSAQGKRSHESESSGTNFELRRNKSQQSANYLSPSSSETHVNKKTRTNFNEQIELKHKEWSEKFAKFMEVLKANSINGIEVELIQSHLQLSETESKNQQSIIYNDLLKLLSPMGPKKVYIFGSKLTGLGFLQSDIDFYVELKNPQKDVIEKAVKLTRYLQGQSFILKYCINTARVPLIRLTHKKTLITCDVNFSTGNGYDNSIFIYKVLKLDKRIKDMAIILKLWSKVHKLSDRLIMSNYCLIMLLFFYLQCIPDAILNTLKNVQSSESSSSSYANSDSTSCWNFSYNENKLFKLNQNYQSTRQLLVGFFEFYNKIDFSKFIICLYNGNLIKIEDFDQEEDMEKYRRTIEEFQLPPFKTAEKENCINVQDPFEHNLNIGIKHVKKAEQFLEILKVSYQKCLDLMDESFSKLLLELFTEVEIKPPEKPRPEKKDKKKFQLKVHSTLGDLKLCQDLLIGLDSTKVYSDADSQKFFYAQLVETTIKLLREVYLCDVTKMESAENVHTFNIKLENDTFRDRKKLNFKSTSAYESEINLSKEMFEKKFVIELDIILTITSKDFGKSIEYEAVNRVANPKSMILSFCNFFSVNITTALRYYLKLKQDELRNSTEHETTTLITPSAPVV